MGTLMTLEEGLKKIDEVIMRKKMMFDGHSHSVVPFTSSYNMEIYDCVYKLCTQKSKDFSEQIYEKYMNCLEERIMEKVIPRLLGKHGAALLTEVTQSWSEFKAFADSLYKYFEILDRFYVRRKELPSIRDAPRHCFCNQVCERLYGKIQEATMSLIIQGREGKDVDWKLLEAVFGFFFACGGKGTTNYYEKFEQLMLAEAAAYYSELSMEWWFWRESFTNYLRKVDWCLVQEEARAKIYPRETTKTKLLEVMKYILLERNAKRWVQKQRADGVAADDQELLSKYASLSLGSSASLAMASD